MRLFPSSIKWQMVVVTAIAFPVTLFAFGWLSLGHVRDSSQITADYQMALTRRIAHELVQLEVEKPGALGRYPRHPAASRDYQTWPTSAPAGGIFRPRTSFGLQCFQFDAALPRIRG
jgi:hypothetical protein